MTFFVSKLALDDFRSWESLVLDLKPGVTVLVGRNGVGKTNIVEAVEFLSQGESHRSSSARNLIRRDQSKATVRVNVTHIAGASRQFEELSGSADPAGLCSTETDSVSLDDNENGSGSAATGSVRTVELTIPQRGAVRSRVNSGPSGYFKDIAGQVKVVVFSPRDQQLVTGDPAGRRAFLDSTATMMFPDYYSLLQNFRHIAKQRAAVLKWLAEGQGRGGGLGDFQAGSLAELEVWTSHFIDVGLRITRRRLAVVNALKEDFAAVYSRLSGRRGQVALAYEPSFEEIFEETAGDDPVINFSSSSLPSDQEIDPAKQAIARHFQRLYAGEVARAANLIGPHRDDLTISLEDMPARDYASNGELWTMGLALKLAQFDYFVRQDSPILILDDVFAQLDESRRRQILDFAADQAQVLITVAAQSDIPDIARATVIDVEELTRQTTDHGRGYGTEDRAKPGETK